MIMLRPVQPSDEAFLFRVYASTRMEEVAAFGWEEAQQQAFLRMQFDMQRRSYAMHYPHARHELICFGQALAGRMLTNRSADTFTLVDISLLPEYRNRGIGSALIRQLQEEAAAAGASICLHVFAGNRAQQLYSRMGFQVSATNDPYIAMIWMPARG
jgi:ribosomal protein S18 acetylase RimI-like enzyme